LEIIKDLNTISEKVKLLKGNRERSMALVWARIFLI
jgi:hypothetical protein